MGSLPVNYRASQEDRYSYHRSGVSWWQAFAARIVHSGSLGRKLFQREQIPLDRYAGNVVMVLRIFTLLLNRDVISKSRSTRGGR